MTKQITQQELIQILNKEPRLTGFGMMDVNQITTTEFGYMRLDVINEIIPFIDSVLTKRKTINHQICGSYGIKHKLEDIFKKSYNEPAYYVSNGECIAAFIFLGYDYKVQYYENGNVFPNVPFNISSKSFKRLM